MEAIFRDTPFVERFFTVIGFSGVTQGINFIRLVDWDERPVKQQDVTKSLFPKLFAIPGLLAFASNPPSLGQSPIDKPVQYVLQSSQPYEVLQAAVDQLTAAARQNPGLQNLDSDLKLNKPQLKVDIDREKAALLGIDVESIGRTVETMLGGRQVTRFKRDGKQYDVMVQLKDVDRTNPDDLREIFVRGGDGSMVALSNLVAIEETVAPKELNHFNKLRAATLTATLAPGYSMGEALAFLDAEAAKLPRGDRHRPQRPEPRVPQLHQRPLRHVPAGAGLHLSGAGGPVRELDRPGDHHADRAAVDDGRAAGAQAHRPEHERLQPDRAGHPGRPDHQARHPDRRVRQPAAGARPDASSRRWSRPRRCACGRS